jgi:translocation protein SEC63
MTLGRAPSREAFRKLEKAIDAELGPRWVHIRQLFQRTVGELDARWDSLILLYAHLLRLPVGDPALQQCAPSSKLI